MARALICGISGQDGAYLARLLLSKGYEIFGTTRNAASSFDNLKSLGIDQRVTTFAMVPSSAASVREVLSDIAVDEIYNLCGQSSVGRSFDLPKETFESVAVATLNFLEFLRSSKRSIRFFNAGSGDCFGDTSLAAASEETPFFPQSPYAVAKASAHYLVATYRAIYGLHACTGIMFNHESPLRSERFVTQKIVRGAAKIAANQDTLLTLGNLDISRDWGWAPEYVEAMWLMLQQTEPRDYVVATGRSVTLRYFVEKAFDYFGLDWARYVRTSTDVTRETEIVMSGANPSRIATELGWQSKATVELVIKNMCAACSQI